MNTGDIIFAIDSEIAKLQKVKTLLTDTDLTTKRKPGRPTGAGAPKRATSFNPVEFAKKSTRRIMSAEGRAKIAAAQRARWAKSKRVAKKTANKAASALPRKVVTAKAIAQKAAQVKNSRVVKKPE